MSESLPGEAPRPVTIITGCSSGIGLATAVRLAEAGHQVVATMRDLTRSGPLRDALERAGVDGAVGVLDVTDDASVTAAVADVLERHGRVDLLVSNAGRAYEGTTEELTVDDFGASIDVNFLGAVRVIKAVLPAMREAGRGRIIAVSSISGVFGQPFNDAYCAAKFALEGLVESLAPVAASFGVHVSLLEPGPVRGGMIERAGGAPVAGPDSPYHLVRQRFGQVQHAGYEHAPQPEAVADVIAHIASAANPALRYQTSRGMSRLLGVKLAEPTGQPIIDLTRSWLT